MTEQPEEEVPVGGNVADSASPAPAPQEKSKELDPRVQLEKAEKAMDKARVAKIKAIEKFEDAAAEYDRIRALVVPEDEKAAQAAHRKLQREGVRKANEEAAKARAGALKKLAELDVPLKDVVAAASAK